MLDFRPQHIPQLPMHKSLLFSDLSLNPKLINNLAKHGFSHATEAQAASIPTALGASDLMLSADTGSGKTLAFLIPCIHRLLTERVNHFSTRCLILAPTRELAHQILSQTNRLIKGTRLQVALVLGGEDYRFQAALLRKNPEIIIATPGRFAEHQRKEHTATQALEILVVDEADRMFELGFSEDVITIAAAANPSQRQTLFYSATLRSANLLNLASQLLQNPVKITLNDVSQVQKNIQQKVIICDDLAHKQRVLTWLLANTTSNKRLVFVNSRALAEQLTKFLHQHNHEALALHGELPQEQRNQITRQFRQHHNNLLVATEVAARGLDIVNIDQVINFDMPRNMDDYLHRVGRTGRAGKQGHALSLINLSERSLLLKLEKLQGKPLPRLQIDAHTAKVHRDGKATRKSPNKTKSPTQTSQHQQKQEHSTSYKKSKKPQTKAFDWGDGTMPFGMKKK